MNRPLRVLMLLVSILALASVGSANAQIKDGAGLRGGIGTDINGGIAFGGEINYTKGIETNALQLAFGVFGGSFSEESDNGFDVGSNGFNAYKEETDIFVVAVLANYLFQYSMETPGPYFVIGAGFGVISVEWTERSATDSSLGTPLPGGGSMQSEEGSAGGSIFNLGIGHRVNEQFDLRFQVPTFVVFGAPGEASAVIPTFSVTAGVQF